MRLPLNLTVASTFALAGIASLAAASMTATVIEETTQESVQAALTEKGLVWAETYAEGLNVFLTGTAPTEAERFLAMSTAGGIVDAARVIDNMNVEAIAALEPPAYSLEILRNEAGISLIGLIPEISDRADLIARLQKTAGRDAQVSDLMETADYKIPSGWSPAMRFALDALEDLPRSKISVAANEVSITAMTDSIEEKLKLERQFSRELPTGLILKLDLSAPRPVITPFTLRAILDEGTLRFDACSADTNEAKDTILSAAAEIGLKDGQDCRIGLGVPSPQWAAASVAALNALQELGGGSVTLTDADISLVVPAGTDSALFDRVVSKTEKALPELFALQATLPVLDENGEVEKAEFIATLSPEGLMQMRGKLGNSLSQTTIESYAQARFGSENVYDAVRLSEHVPASWPIRVMAGLDALSKLNNGSVTVTPDHVDVTGKTGSQSASAEISQVLSGRLGGGQQFSIDVAYEETLDPLASIPTPEECIAKLERVQSSVKISFEPGSGTLDANAAPILDAMAIILEECGELPLEIQGHTDSQGRESMNLALSQNRAQSVLAALRDRRILTGSFVAKGFGEANPIADNGTEEGREANRRIEFVLITQDEEAPVDDEDVSLDGSEDTATEGQETLENSGDPVDEGALDEESATQETGADDQN
ncbi:OmpA family protein [Cognatishimia maritima]|uniref:OmpA-OmpF porin, OOP family n=1 Tax=Cognatishimia maritima TaxID=870908 RepID=A0A1M5RP11_9RHOB|nr:OmpA family protein [Cognatishimia maritima]SHH27838.1 OmpA-OmpF porin, OOP family [Cognatishimia maritima]